MKIRACMRAAGGWGAIVLSVACSSGGGGEEVGSAVNAGAGMSAVAGGGGGGNGMASGGSISLDLGGASSPAEAPAAPITGKVYGHSDRQLFSLDPLSFKLTSLGTLETNDEELIDLAVNAVGEVFVCTGQSLYKVNPETLALTQVGRAGVDRFYPNSLTFLPEEVFGEGMEVLVGFQGSDYVRIDPADGAQRRLGTLAGGMQSSGDVVSVSGGKTLVTVTGGTCSDTDCLLEINPQDGGLVKNWGRLGVPNVWGLSSWGGRAFGFTEGGRVFEIALEGETPRVNDVPVQGGLKELSFWGAGSGTTVPVEFPWDTVR